MLRITALGEDSQKLVLKVEGQIVSDWVPLLDKECRRLLEANELVLDFSCITYIDSHGIEMLRKLPVEIVNCSRLIEDMLESCGGCGSKPLALTFKTNLKQ